VKALAVLLAALALAQAQNTVIQTETRVVLVDAIVTAKNGKYVHDLTAKDFRVWQDNKEQVISSFALESSAAASQPRSMVLFFDETSMELRDQIPARQAASSLIDARTGPNRRMAVVSYNGTLHVAQNFTENAGRLKDALPQPESRVVQQEERPGRPAMGAQLPAVADDSGARNMFRSLRNLGESLGVLPGRKIIVLFVGKLGSSSAQRADLKDAIESCNKSGVAVYPIDVRPVSTAVDSGATPVRAGPVGRAATARTSGPHGDPDDSEPGLPDTGAGSQQLLFELAGRTGGFVITNSNDLLGGLQEIAGEQDEYYVLSYTPPEAKEGSCHTLRVKVDRSGTTVRARSTYCTSKPQDLLAGTSTGKELEKRAAAAPTGNVAASIALPYFYVSPNVARVHLAMEIAPGTLKVDNQKGKFHAQLDLLGIASTEDGGVRARFSDALKFDFENEAQVRAWKEKPLHYEKEFRIAPGQYTFTMAFGQGDESGGNVGKVETPLVVDPWAGSELALSGLVLSREIHAAADVGLSMSIANRTPLIAAGNQVVPSGSVKFAQSGAGFFYFEVYASETPAKVRVRVVDRKTGDAKWDSGIATLPMPADGGKPSIPAASKLPLESLPPGVYRLEVTASDSSRQATRTADFEID
jgi:VWFA-related protein